MTAGTLRHVNLQQNHHQHDKSQVFLQATWPPCCPATVTALKAYYVFAVHTHTTNIEYINFFKTLYAVFNLFSTSYYVLHVRFCDK